MSARDDKGGAAWQALAELLPFVLEDYMPEYATPEFRKAVETAKAVIGAPPVPELDGCCPLVLYFDHEDDRRGFIEAVQGAKPGMRTLQL